MDSRKLYKLCEGQNWDFFPWFAVILYLYASFSFMRRLQLNIPNWKEVQEDGNRPC